MNTQKETIIHFNKFKLSLLIAGAVIFVALGVIITALGAGFFGDQIRYNNSMFTMLIGVVCLLFFGICGIIGIKKLLDDSPGLILDKTGITDNSSGVSAGLIPWTEVLSIAHCRIQRQRFITIHVSDPEKYAGKGNLIQRAASKTNLKIYGTSIMISANPLNISFYELYEIIEAYFQLHRNDAS